MGFDAAGIAQAAATQDFGPKIQLGGSLALVMTIPLASWLDLATSIEAFGILPSDATGGFLYRGFGGGALEVGVSAHFPVVHAASFGHLSAGPYFAAAASLPAYSSTSLYFFYPEVSLGADVQWRPAGSPGMAVRLGLPVRVLFRRDMSYSVSTGIELGISWRVDGTE